MEEETAAAARVVGRAEAARVVGRAEAARVVGKGCPCTSRHVGSLMAQCHKGCCRQSGLRCLSTDTANKWSSSAGEVGRGSHCS